MNSKVLIDSRSLFDRHKGGITVYTENAIKEIGEKFGGKK